MKRTILITIFLGFIFTSFISAQADGLLSVTMVPDDDSVMVYPGGSFGFTGTATNLTSRLIYFDLWVNVYNPTYGSFPVLSYNNNRLGAYESYSAHLTQDVPFNAPPGIWFYRAYVGYPSQVQDSAMFEFTVLERSGKIMGKPAETWNLIGWDNGTLIPTTDQYGLLSIEMIPDDDSVIVQPGGSFGFTGTATNLTSRLIYFDLWVEVYNPTYGTFPVFSYGNNRLEGNESYSVHLTQDVPFNAPPGRWLYMAYAGYPSQVQDSAMFGFLVLETSGNNIDKLAKTWNLIGWDETTESVPSSVSISSNYPNPFNASTTVTFELPIDSNVSLEVYNLIGQKVAVLADGYTQAGKHSVTWDASNQSSGVYFYKLLTDENVSTKRMTLLK